MSYGLHWNHQNLHLSIQLHYYHRFFLDAKLVANNIQQYSEPNQEAMFPHVSICQFCLICILGLDGMKLKALLEGFPSKPKKQWIWFLQLKHQVWHFIWKVETHCNTNSILTSGCCTENFWKRLKLVIGSLYEGPRSFEPCFSMIRPKFVPLDWYLRNIENHDSNNDYGCWQNDTVTNLKQIKFKNQLKVELPLLPKA